MPSSEHHTRLEGLKPNSVVGGIVPNGQVTVNSVEWHGTETIDLVYRDGAGNLHSELLFRDDESRLEIVTEGQPWSFDADGELLWTVA